MRALQHALLVSSTTSSDAKMPIKKADSWMGTARIVLHSVGAGLAALCLKSEIAYMIQRRRLPPGDSGPPIVGHLLHLITNGEAFYIKLIRKYGTLCTHNALMHPVVIVTTGEDVRWAMMQERKGKTKALVLSHFRDLLGKESIMMKSGEEHKRLRKAFEPAFTPLAIRDYATAIDHETQKRLAEWAASGEFQEPRQWALLAMRIFFVCAFGVVDSEREVKLAYLFEKWTNGFTALIPMKIPGTLLAKAHKYKQELGDVLIEMINEFREKSPPDSEAGRKSVMGRLCYAVDEDGNMPSEEVLVDNLRFFLVAGFDTTKASFGAISHFLKQKSHAEAALVKEVQAFQCDTLDVDRLKNEAPVLNAIMAESWRLTPPLTNHSTVAVEDLEYKGFYIPKGTFIRCDHQAHAQMNDELYPNASKFCFERWLPKDHPLYDADKANSKDIDYNVMSTDYRTFNSGPHMCLGGHFAKLELRIVLTRLFQSYEIHIRNDRLVMFPTKQRLNDFKLTKRRSP